MKRALAVLTLAAGLAVLVHAPAGSSSAAPPAPHVGVSNARLLRLAGGHLWWAGYGCRPTRYDLGSGRLTVSPRRYCLIWPSPDGTRALAAGTANAFPAPPGSLALLSGPSLGTATETPLREDGIVPPVVWSPDGRLALACVREPSSTPTIELVEPPWRRALALSNRCTPALAGRAVLASAGGRVFVNGHPQFGAALRAGLRGRRPEVTAMAFAQGHLAVAEAAGSRSRVVVIDTTTRSVTAVAIPHRAAQIALSPDATQLWYQAALHGTPELEELDGRVPPGGVPDAADAYAWSPDARFVAAARHGVIQVFDRDTGRMATIHSGPVTALAWTE
jgi:hypothetical protein